MKVTLLALFVTLLMVGCGESSNPSESAEMNNTAPKKDAIETAVDWSKLEDRDGVKYLPNEKTSFTGRAESFHENGQKEKEVNFKDGKEDGLHSYWYENGQKMEKKNYKDGKQDGLWTAWYESGQKTLEENYNEGKQDGLETWWYENGQKKWEVNFKDGKEDGLHSYWYENGQKLQEANRKDGKTDGLVIIWYENGQKMFEGNYKDDKLMSAVAWKPNGEKCPFTNLKEGNGVAVMYEEDGTEWKRTTYKDGKEVED